MTAAGRPSAARPEIVLGATDQQRLTAAAIHALIETPRLAAGLLEEVDRARVVPDHALDGDVARLGSWVEFDEGGLRHRMRLALDPSSAHDLPVLSILGAALIGLRVGASIRLPDRVGAQREVTLLAVDTLGRAPTRDGRSSAPCSADAT